jgi:predicted transcriptional regulator/DNA-binding XRE family transcriptional regulator
MERTGAKIRTLRKEQKLTQSALADAVGISPSYLNLIENGKRAVGGKVLAKIAESLGKTRETLNSPADRRLTACLQEVLAEPAIQPVRPSLDDAAVFVTQHPEWARAIIALHQAYRERDRAAHALSDRLNNDPFISESVHNILSRATAIGSISEILNDARSMPKEQRSRFYKSLLEESESLAHVSRAMAMFFDKTETTAGDETPDEQVDAFLTRRNNYFDALEDQAAEMRASAGIDTALNAGSIAKLGAYLEQSTGRKIIVHSFEEDETTNRVPRNDPMIFHLREDELMSSRQFFLARELAKAHAAATVEAELVSATELTSGAALARARRALFGYVAGAFLMPYGAFFKRAEALRYDIDALSRMFSVSFEQAAHRLATLRRPNLASPPFAFMRVDLSGFMTKRLPLPGLPLPRLGRACPLWIVYRTFQRPGVVIGQRARFPAGDEFLLLACAVAKPSRVHGSPPRLMSIMLGCGAVHADRIAYADSVGKAEDVGPTCALCIRVHCDHRQEAPVFAD